MIDPVPPNTSPNLWAHKPWWCQPWSIVLTGISLIGGSWLAFHTLWLTIPAIGAIVLWWWYFLWVVPRWFAAEQADH